MAWRLDPVRRLRGQVRVPGDKSISHRMAMLSAIAEGETVIEGYSESADCVATLSCLRQLGVRIQAIPGGVRVGGAGKQGLRHSPTTLDAANSGTTIRLLAGILAGQPFETQITGDASLRRRPMRRIIEPLRRMGATISAVDDNLAPLVIRGGPLRGITQAASVASAQVKSCLLLAGLFAEGETTVIEAIPTRDHTERLLGAFGVPVVVTETTRTVSGGYRLQSPGRLRAPGDFSSAAFLLAAGLMVEPSALTIEGVGLNPTRTGMLTALQQSGTEIVVANARLEGGEPVGDLWVDATMARPTRPLRLEGALTANAIDEIPILAVLGARFAGLSVADAGELRVKESDRLALMVHNLRAMGVEVEEHPDGLTIPGGQRFRGAAIETAGDHRIAMAFAVAALTAEGPTTIDDAACVRVSFPDFFTVLERLQR
ncbi:3-phosphoshikimate 1-carboxyvinyltransferase [Chloracidobacterium validum]|uniref:3-phosphoshikimate 1-carboxyvinyltransferase n=1 Tax=Chloracidobacterium validum TaxID=2821543 RepID=A0ABX8B9T2_9BACT|nr:3-phosphoshikimate 1-carboxyvinyltransferase [Chloracidobacterium validum]QUW03702.1 3-phosphoshikimate 1-carboxyvinyltransferase [Chloracidobacterium validum]